MYISKAYVMRYIRNYTLFSPPPSASVHHQKAVIFLKVTKSSI